MPDHTTKKKADKDLAEGRSPSTAAREFVREEVHHIRQGKHGAKNAKQAIAIGLSKARRAGVDLKPGPGASKSVRKKAAQESARAGRKPNPRRSRAGVRALKRQPRVAASPEALSRHAKSSAERRRKQGGPNSPKAVARRAAQTRKRRRASGKSASV